jgi:transmembrane sensor
MTRLDELGAELRAELGSAPEPWLRAQNSRAHRALSAPAARPRALAFALAAASALVVGLLLFSLRASRPEAVVARVTSLAAQGQPSRAEFPDGSAVTLAPGGGAHFASDAAATRFELERGFAEFEIAPQRGKRFVVVAGAVEVSVVGTRFSVRYSPPANVEVQVSHGVVSVRAPGRPAPVLLRAGERFRGSHEQWVFEPTATASVTPPAPVDVRAEAPATAMESGSVPAPAPTSNLLPPAPSWEALYRERRYAASLALAKEQGFDRLLAALSAHKLSDLADAARLGGDAGLALRALGALQRRFPGTREASDAEFLIGRVHAARGEGAAALARFEKYLQYGEQAPYAVETMGRLVELYSGRGQVEKARAMAERYLARAPNGAYRRLCQAVLEKR